MRRRHVGIGVLAVVTVAVIVSLVWAGRGAFPQTEPGALDGRDPDRRELWTISTRHSATASVDTAIWDLADVRVSEREFTPIGVLQTDGAALAYSEEGTLRRLDGVTPGKPVPIPVSADRISAGRSAVLFLNSTTGQLAVATVDEAVQGKATRIRIAAQDGRIVAATITPAGNVWGLTDRGVLIRTHVGQTRPSIRTETGARIPAGAQVQLTVFGEHWATLVQVRDDSPILRVDGGTSRSVQRGAVLQEPDEAAKTLSLAQPGALLQVGAEGRVRTIRVPGRGIPAAPRSVGGCLHAAWMQSDRVQFRSCGRVEEKRLPKGSDSTRFRPELTVVGKTPILRDISSGLMWYRGGGVWKFLTGSASWLPPPQTDSDEGTAQEAREPQGNECPVPPRGAATTFGIRAGRAGVLPVLAGVTDPNRGESLSISMEHPPQWVGPSLGKLGVAPDRSMLIVDAAQRPGTSEFTVGIVDSGGCEVAVTGQVTVQDDNGNRPPVWSRPEWATPADLQVAPGGSISFDGRVGWVDPESDLIRVDRVEVSGPAQAAADAAGRVVVTVDEGAPPGAVSVSVVVKDTRGASSERHRVEIEVVTRPTFAVLPVSRAVPLSQRTWISLEDVIRGVRPEDEPIITSVRPAPGDAADVNTEIGGGRLGVFVTAGRPGTFTVSWNIRAGERSATGRIHLMVAAGNPEISPAPMTAVLRPHRDAVIDPLESLQAYFGPTLRLLEDPVVTPVGAQSRVEAQVLSGATLRVSGVGRGTAAEQIGEIRYTVSDGARMASGTVVVFLEAEQNPPTPVAVPDRARVRAGDVADISVLDNDVASAGGELRLDPRWSIEASGGISFPSGRLLRYAAPETPGRYTVSYRIAVIGNPDRLAVGTVTVTVLPASAPNRNPVPAEVFHRVPSGAAVDISVPSQDQDPDGDRMSFVEILEEDGPGVAQILSTGAMRITGTETPGMFSGVVRVEDTHGGTAPLHVRVLVLGDAADVPVAFSDVAETVIGQPVSMAPLKNDRSESHGTLTLGEIRPVRDLGTDARTPAAVRSPGSDLVTFRSEAPGRYVYSYTAVSSSGGILRGRILLVVAPDGIPPYPSLPDLTVHAEELSGKAGDEFRVDVFSRGLDWDPHSDLAVSVARGAGVRAVGSALHGKLGSRAQTAVIRIQVSGAVDPSTRGPVRTYGVLHIPSAGQFRPELRAPEHQYPVREGTTTLVDLMSAVVPRPGGELEILTARPLGRRAQAMCSVDRRGVRYSPGLGPGVQDACVVEARWTGQPHATRLVVRFRVQLRDPIPEFRSGLLTVVEPGGHTAVDLERLVERNGAAQSFRFACGSGTQTVQVTCERSWARISVTSDARQGEVVHFPVRIVSPTYSQQPEALLSVQVALLPTRALVAVPIVVSLEQRDSGGASIEQELVAPNRHRSPYLPLTLAGPVLFPDGEAQGVLIGSRVRLSVPASARSGSIRGYYEIADAQGNRGLGEIVILYRARPDPPRVTLQRVDATSVTFALSSASGAEPTVTSYTVSGPGGAEVSCPATGAVTFCRVPAPTNQLVQFRVRAVNAVGASTRATEIPGLAYSAPGNPEVTSSLHPTRPGWVVLHIRGEPVTRAFRVEGREFQYSGQGELRVELLVETARRVVVEAIPAIAPLPSAERPENTPGRTAVDVQPLQRAQAMLVADPVELSPGRVRLHLSTAGAGGEPVGIQSLVGAAVAGETCRPSHRAPAEVVLPVPTNREVEVVMCAEHQGVGVDSAAYRGALSFARIFSLKLPDDVRYALVDFGQATTYRAITSMPGVSFELVEAPSRLSQRARFRACIGEHCGIVEARPDPASLPYLPSVQPAQHPTPEFVATTDAEEGMVQISWAGPTGITGVGGVSSTGRIFLRGVPDGFRGRILVSVRGLVGIGVFATCEVELGAAGRLGESQ